MVRLSLVSARKVVAAAFVLVLALAGFVVWRASRVLRSAGEEVQAERQIRFVVRPLPPATSTNSIPLARSSACCRRARAPWIAADRASAAVLADSHTPELVLATSEAGILAYDGQSFRQIFPYDANARAITAILPDASGHLLIGTRKRGVLVYAAISISATPHTVSSCASFRPLNVRLPRPPPTPVEWS
jgi:Tfp pilus assembly protein FimT